MSKDQNLAFLAKLGRHLLKEDQNLGLTWCDLNISGNIGGNDIPNLFWQNLWKSKIHRFTGNADRLQGFLKENYASLVVRSRN